MLKARVFTALLLVIGLLAALFILPVDGTKIILAVIAVLAGWEWAGLMKIDRAGRFFYCVLILISCWVVYVPAVTVFPRIWGLAAVFWLLIAPFWLFRHWSIRSNDLLGYGMGWLLIIPTWAAMAYLHERSPWLLLAAMAMVWVADSAAYFAGRALGRRKLAPTISPGKTWEGAAGALLGVMVYGGILLGVAGDAASGFPVWPWGPALLFLLTAISIVGDLFESLIKRQAEVKDSGQLLPGHGGILDRIDSLTSTLPVVALVVWWLAK